MSSPPRHLGLHGCALNILRTNLSATNQPAILSHGLGTHGLPSPHGESKQLSGHMRVCMCILHGAVHGACSLHFGVEVRPRVQDVWFLEPAAAMCTVAPAGVLAM